MGRFSYFLICLLFLSTAHAWANGCYIPQRAYPALPTIPVQRAIIVHRQGQETLIVESGFQTASPEVGWILPLPAAPTKLEVAERGMITSLNMSLRPKITHDLHTYLSSTVVFVMIPLTLTLLLVVLFRKTKWIEYLVVGFVFFLLFAILLPSLGSARGHGRPRPRREHRFAGETAGQHAFQAEGWRRSSG